MKKNSDLLLLGLVLSCCTIALCQVTTVGVRIGATFHNTVCDGSGCNPVYCGGYSDSKTCPQAGYPDSTGQIQARWGKAVDTNRYEVSGLGFYPSDYFETPFDTDFFMGTITHFNYPITNAAKSTILDVRFNITSTGGTPLSVTTFSFTFQIDETPNDGKVSNCPYPSSTPCSDKISYPNSGFDQNAHFTVGDVEYTLQLKGFKESQSSTSLPLDSFISNEGDKRIGYLFARITAACPTSCEGGGDVIITPAQQCVCDCSGATPCTVPKAFSPNCSCICPNSCQNNGVLTSNCGCDCSASTCPTPKVPATTDCSCVCPDGYCNTGYINNTSTCSCACPPLQDMNCGPNFVLDSTCQCYCNLNCGAIGKVRSSVPDTCDCICAPGSCNTTAGFVQNATTCECTCQKDCPNGVVNYNDCTCGACFGDWVKNVTTDQCTVCGLTTCEGDQAVVDPAVCACVCENLTCDINIGLVVNTSDPCGCRPCRAGECKCGNGLVEPGEDCDLGTNPPDPCCVNCKYTFDTCDDGNLCTDRDRCDGHGTCRGGYKCPGSTTCSNSSCDAATGNCYRNNSADGSGCETTFGAGDFDLCARRCYAGNCEAFPTSGPLAKPTCFDDNPSDCLVSVCEPTNGSCVIRVADDNTPCSDGLACTTNDTCVSGICSGVRIDCTGQVSVTQCQTPECFEGFSSYQCVARDVRNGFTCDDGNLCTIIDVCLNGICKAVGYGVQCPENDQCNNYMCAPENGTCIRIALDGNACNDGKICTENDVCVEGTCTGEATNRTNSLPECGFIAPKPSSGGNNALIIFAAAGGAALIAAIVGAALIIKKIQRSKLLDPATWNPDMFNSVGTNPLFQASQKMVENPLHDAHST